MSKADDTEFMRVQASTLESRLSEPRRHMQIVAGPRQVGKTTIVTQVLARLETPSRFVSADIPSLRDAAWLTAQWEDARALARESGRRGAILAIDEVQKIGDWSEMVKSLWDEDSRAKRPLRVVLLGSSPHLMQRGLTESMAGRFETIHVPHWSLSEMRAAFDVSLEQYLFFGGYPGAAPYMRDVGRWRRFILESLVETTIARDVLLLARIGKPALMRRLFELGCAHSGQVLSFNKMLGQLQDASNTITLASYLEFLAGAGTLIGLRKFAGNAVRQRASSPKLQVFNTALMTATSSFGPRDLDAQPEFRGRLVESAIGAHLVNASAGGACELFYWRDGNDEVDFVIRAGRTVVAIEVKSGRVPRTHSGLATFAERFRPTRSLIVGGDGTSVEDFLARPAERWLES